MRARPAPAASARSSAATSRWTATRAGTARSRPRPARARHGGARGRVRRGGVHAGLRARRDGRVHPRDDRSATRTPRSATGDSVFAFNFRPDRMRQITEALRTEDGVEHYACLTEYEEGWPYPVAFPPERPEMTLAEAASPTRGETQLHVAETEKYPHVTYFFNGGEEEPYEGEVRELVPSPRDVPTYDHKPEMSARGVRRRVHPALARGRPRVRDHQLRQRGHGRAHRRDRGRRQGGSRRSTSASATSSRRSTARAAPASSPPTTATPTRCSRTTARRTPRTHSTRCRSSSPWTA